MGKCYYKTKNIFLTYLCVYQFPTFQRVSKSKAYNRLKKTMIHPWDESCSSPLLPNVYNTTNLYCNFALFIESGWNVSYSSSEPSAEFGDLLDILT